MIIFDLDGTLADCEHRRHLVDPSYQTGCNHWPEDLNAPLSSMPCVKCKNRFNKWKPDYKSFYEACDQDTPIIPVISVMRRISQHEDVQIWSGRCESVREKTVDWFDKHISCFAPIRWFDKNLKMRPEGDNTPDEQLKEKWLNERCSDLIESQFKQRIPINHDINFVFDDRTKVIKMLRRRGIFVFDCNQNAKEF